MPPGVVTVTSTTLPAVPAGETAVSDVEVLYVTDAALTNPNDTVEPDVKPVPVMVTVVPPTAKPLAGAIPVTDGTAS